MCNCPPLTDEQKREIAERYLGLKEVDCATRQLREEAFKSRSAKYDPTLLTDEEIIFDAWLRHILDLAAIGSFITKGFGM